MDPAGDTAVAATNDDAAICKYQAVQKGYYSDPYIDKLLSLRVKQTAPRKAPEINRGYFARSASIAYITEKFIETYPDAQIISLGSGYDTLYWRLKDGLSKMNLSNKQVELKYIEIDMSPVVFHKIMAIKRHKELSQSLLDIKFKNECMHTKDYHLISFDLRQVDKMPLKTKLVEECKFDVTKPTLCIAECVLVYMPLHDSTSLILWLSENLNSSNNLTMINYEQCNLGDRFGDIMVANMNARHCDLMGAEACKSLESQEQRFKSSGLPHTRGWTLLSIYKECLSPSSIERISNIEFLDERELLEQLLEHYCIVIGSQKEIDWLPDQEYWLSNSTSGE